MVQGFRVPLIIAVLVAPGLARAECTPSDPLSNLSNAVTQAVATAPACTAPGFGHGSASGGDEGSTLGLPNVANDWTDSFIKQHYGEDASVFFVTGFQNAIQNSPLGELFGIAMDPFNPFDAGKIADACKKAYPNDQWQQIHCASVETDKYVEKNVPESSRDSSGGGPGLRSFCRDHAEMFKMVFSALNIPGSSVGERPVNDNHVVNKITLTGADGNAYSYIIDTGWDPNNIYPFGDNAQKYASQHPYVFNSSSCKVTGSPLPPLDKGGFDLASIPIFSAIPPISLFFGSSPRDLMAWHERNFQGPGYPIPPPQGFAPSS